jgi:hypothetical protein
VVKQLTDIVVAISVEEVVISIVCLPSEAAEEEIAFVMGVEDIFKFDLKCFVKFGKVGDGYGAKNQ